jgi:tetratricopeptide (TPR) repeat protein
MLICGHNGDAMRIFSGASLTALAMLALATVGCGQMSELRAKKAFKEANQAYAAQDYKKSAELYEETIQADPNLGLVGPAAYFYLGNSYDNQYKPSRQGEADNDVLLAKAVENYQTAAEKLSASDKPEDKKLGQLALDFLVAAYGPDKMNDPAKAEPVVQRMIQLDPSDPANYFKLATIYENAGAYENAEDILLKAKEARPNDPTVYTTLASYYNRQGQFEKTITALQERAAKEPNNPEAFQTLAVFYWDKAFRDARLKENEKKDFVQKGIVAVDKGLQIKPDYIDALIYKNLLLRLQANTEKDPSKQQALLKEANELRDKAEDLRKKKASGVGT